MGRISQAMKMRIWTESCIAGMRNVWDVYTCMIIIWLELTYFLRIDMFPHSSAD